MLTRRTLLATAILTTGPARSQESAQKGAQHQPLPVAASFSILADLARQIGGEYVAVTELIGPNQDAHLYQPGPADARKIGAARLILLNGLGFEPGALTRMIAATNPRAAQIVLSNGLPTLKASETAAEHGHGHSHATPAAADPHLWQSVANMQAYARALAQALRAAAPQAATAIDAGLARYIVALETLDADIRAAMATIPAERRVIATTHDAFGYFAATYGLTIHTLQGVSTETEPSAADMARIIRQLKALKAPAVFLENVTDARKAQMIARESGARIGGTLYSDSLSLANGPAPTYIDMMRHNVREIVQALKP